MTRIRTGLLIKGMKINIHKTISKKNYQEPSRMGRYILWVAITSHLPLSIAQEEYIRIGLS